MEIPWFAGIILFVGVIIFIYILKFSKKSGDHKNVNAEKNGATGEPVRPVRPTQPKREDIVLTEITSSTSVAKDYGILWNGIPGKTYNYSIKDNGTGAVIAESSATSKTNVFKIRGLPLGSSDSPTGKTYLVKVGDTEVIIPFTPVQFILPLNLEDDKIDCDTDITPTNLEIVLNNTQKVPISALHLKIEPPGFLCNYEGLKGKDITIMIYNGKNTTNMLEIQRPSPRIGETPISF